MRDRNDPGSVDMFPGTKRGRGRPKTGTAVSAAERAARYRERKKVETDDAMAELAKEVRRLKRQLRNVTKIDNNRDVTKKKKL
jgi:hypothetical protein